MFPNPKPKAYANRRRSTRPERPVERIDTTPAPITSTVTQEATPHLPLLQAALISPSPQAPARQALAPQVPTPDPNTAPKLNEQQLILLFHWCANFINQTHVLPRIERDTFSYALRVLSIQAPHMMQPLIQPIQVAMQREQFRDRGMEEFMAYIRDSSRKNL